VHSALPKTAHRGPVPRGTGGLGAAGVPAHSLLEGRQPRDEYRRLPRLGRRPEGRRERGQGRHGGVRRDQGPGARGPPRPALEKRTGQREFGRYVMRELVLSFSRIITVTVNNKCHPLAIHKEPVTFFLSISKLQRYGAATILVNNIQVSSQSRITRHPPSLSLPPPSISLFQVNSIRLRDSPSRASRVRAHRSHRRSRATRKTPRASRRPRRRRRPSPRPRRRPTARRTSPERRPRSARPRPRTANRPRAEARFPRYPARRSRPRTPRAPRPSSRSPRRWRWRPRRARRPTPRRSSTATRARRRRKRTRYA
jgi:hypothetical protein